MHPLLHLRQARRQLPLLAAACAAEIPRLVRSELSALSKLDVMSIEFCRVLDLSHAMADLHPDPAARQMSESVSISLHKLVQDVNVDPALYRHLKNQSPSEADGEVL